MGIFDIFKGSDLNFKGVNVKEVKIIATEIDNKVKKIIPILEELLKKNISKEKFQTELKNKKIDFHDEITWETQIILGDDKNLLKMNRPGKELTDKAITLSEEFNNFKGYKVSRI
mgnify:CR=1 FL=1